MAKGPIPQSYDRAQRAFHWIMAAVILIAIAIGVAAWLSPEHAPQRPGLMMLHKSLGMTALVLAVLRVVYRAKAGAPPYGETLSTLMRAAANLAHFALYALMIALAGQSATSTSTAGGHEVSWFGVFVWPALVAPDKALAHLADSGPFLARLDDRRGSRAPRRRGRLARLGSSATTSSRACGRAGRPSPARANGAEASLARSVSGPGVFMLK